MTRRVERIIRRLAEQEQMTFREKALNITSLYGINNTGDEYLELPCELLSASRSTNKAICEEALKILKEALFL